MMTYSSKRINTVGLYATVTSVRTDILLASLFFSHHSKSTHVAKIVHV